MEPVGTKADVALPGQREQLRALSVAQLGLFGSLCATKPGRRAMWTYSWAFRKGARHLRFFILIDFVVLLGREVELLTQPGLSKYVSPHILNTTEYVLPAAA
jgi:predicted nucleotidyltransferase